MVWWEYAQLFVVVALASMCQNLTGFAFGLIFVGVAGALQLLPIADAANVACLLSLVNGAVYLRSHPFTPRWDVLKPLAITSLLGTLLGLALLHWLSGGALGLLRMLLGAAIVVCAFVLLLQKTQRTTPSSQPAAWLAGSLAGVLGGLFSTSGPPLVYHLYRQPLPAMVVRQSLLALFLMGNVLRLGVVLAMGELAWSSVVTSAVALPVVAVVTWFFAKYPPPLPARLLQWLVCTLLVLAGVSLLASAL
jgi:uncharacterized protein